MPIRREYTAMNLPEACWGIIADYADMLTAWTCRHDYPIPAHIWKEIRPARVPDLEISSDDDVVQVRRIFGVRAGMNAATKMCVRRAAAGIAPEYTMASVPSDAMIAAIVPHMSASEDVRQWLAAMVVKSNDEEGRIAAAAVRSGQLDILELLLANRVQIMVCDEWVGTVAAETAPRLLGLVPAYTRHVLAAAVSPEWTDAVVVAVSILKKDNMLDSFRLAAMSMDPVCLKAGLKTARLSMIGLSMVGAPKTPSDRIITAIRAAAACLASSGRASLWAAKRIIQATPGAAAAIRGCHWERADANDALVTAVRTMINSALAVCSDAAVKWIRELVANDVIVRYMRQASYYTPIMFAYSGLQLCEYLCGNFRNASEIVYSNSTDISVFKRQYPNLGRCLFDRCDRCARAITGIASIAPVTPRSRIEQILEMARPYPNALRAITRRVAMSRIYHPGGRPVSPWSLISTSATVRDASDVLTSELDDTCCNKCYLGLDSIAAMVSAEDVRAAIREHLRSRPTPASVIWAVLRFNAHKEHSKRIVGILGRMQPVLPSVGSHFDASPDCADVTDDIYTFLRFINVNTKPGIESNSIENAAEGDDAEGDDAEGDDAEGDDAEGDDAEGDDGYDEDGNFVEKPIILPPIIYRCEQ